MDEISKAELREASATKRKVFGRPFPKGVSGCPGGKSPKREISRILREFLDEEEGVQLIHDFIVSTFRRAIKGHSPMAAVLLFKEMADRTEGKVAQDVKLSGSIDTMSDEELIKRLEILLGLEHEPSGDPMST